MLCRKRRQGSPGWKRRECRDCPDRRRQGGWISCFLIAIRMKILPGSIRRRRSRNSRKLPWRQSMQSRTAPFTECGNRKSRRLFRALFWRRKQPVMTKSSRPHFPVRSAAPRSTGFSSCWIMPGLPEKIRMRRPIRNGCRSWRTRGQSLLPMSCRHRPRSCCRF